jgi:hypothetical protein
MDSLFIEPKQGFKHRLAKVFVEILNSYFFAETTIRVEARNSMDALHYGYTYLSKSSQENLRKRLVVSKIRVPKPFLRGVWNVF